MDELTSRHFSHEHETCGRIRKLIQNMRESLDSKACKIRRGDKPRPKKNFPWIGISDTSEEIISKLREAELLLCQGQPLGAVCREMAISEQTYWFTTKVLMGRAD